MKPLVIYHGNCADGFTAAWAVWTVFGNDADYHAGVYQDPPPDVSKRDVILVDFSYKQNIMLEMSHRARSMLVLDHHKSAAEDLPALRGLEGRRIDRLDDPKWQGELSWLRHLGNTRMDENEGCPYAVIYALFDQSKSGAKIAWEFFRTGVPVPRFVEIISDRDLWEFKLPYTRDVMAAIFSHAYDFKTWNDLYEACEDDEGLHCLRIEGSAIERKHHKDVAELVGVMKRRMVIGGTTVWVANLPYTLTSDAGSLMCEGGEPFAACYWDTPDGRVFSLRSREGGVDVSAIAKAYGGGGHKNASGFRKPIGWEGDAP